MDVTQHTLTPRAYEALQRIVGKRDWSDPDLLVDVTMAYAMTLELTTGKPMTQILWRVVHTMPVQSMIVQDVIAASTVMNLFRSDPSLASQPLPGLLGHLTEAVSGALQARAAFYTGSEAVDASLVHRFVATGLMYRQEIARGKPVPVVLEPSLAESVLTVAGSGEDETMYKMKNAHVQPRDKRAKRVQRLWDSLKVSQLRAVLKELGAGSVGEWWGDVCGVNRLPEDVVVTLEPWEGTLCWAPRPKMELRALYLAYFSAEDLSLPFDARAPTLF